MRDIIVNDIITIPLNRTVKSAQTLMDYFNVDCLVVTDENEPVGMITKNSVIEKIKVTEMNPCSIFVEDVFSQPLIWVQYNATITEVARIMNKENIKRVPIFGNLSHGPILLGMYTVKKQENTIEKMA